MKILNPQSATLSNYEVFAHLTSRREASLLPAAPERRSGRDRERERPQQRKLKAPNYEAVSREILEYLSPGSTSSVGHGNSGSASSTGHAKDKSDKDAGTSSNSSNVEKTFPLPPYISRAAYSNKAISSLLVDLALFDLAKAEALMIVNLRPTDAASLDAIVEEVDERFDEQTQEEILALVRTWLGTKDIE